MFVRDCSFLVLRFEFCYLCLNLFFVVDWYLIFSIVFVLLHGAYVIVSIYSCSLVFILMFEIRPSSLFLNLLFVIQMVLGFYVLLILIDGIGLSFFLILLFGLNSWLLFWSFVLSSCVCLFVRIARVRCSLFVARQSVLCPRELVNGLERIVAGHPRNLATTNSASD